MNEMNPLRRLRAVDPDDAQADVMTDALREAGRGSEAAFRRFYEAASALVYGTVLRVVRDRAIAEEVAQEVFVELWRLAPRFDAGKGTARAWAATIAHRRAVDRVRSEQSRRDREDRDNQAATIDHDSVSEQVDDSLERERVRRALIDLSDTQREAVTLAYYGGHTYREVAVLLDVAEGTAKTRIRDGLIKLRDTMGVTS
ncbi:MAG: RNA polymerase sigma factor SigK [Acidimicrobiales bacterium]|nr:MAG: RNA polymerase sigma factor SigK [Acidimicrobiales bacterium]